MSLERIWIVVERAQDAPAAASLELLSRATQLAGTVEGVTWGDAEPLAAAAGSYGASVLHTVGDLGGGLPGPVLAAAVAEQIAAGNVPDAVLVPQTYDGRDVAGRLSARAARPVLTNVTGLEVSEGGLVSEHAIFGGTQVLEARFTGAAPAIFVVRPKSFPAEASGGGRAAVDTWAVPDLGAIGSASIASSHAEQSEGPELDEAEVVVSGGRGLGDADNYQMVEELARLLKGAPGASRAIVDAGWVPYSHQVGQTGKTVKPALYIACGISGATQHMVGMKGAKSIVAINKDREAPIFAIADLGVVGDVQKILPKLIEALRRRA